MYSTRYNPMIPFVAAAISIISTIKIMKQITAPPSSFNHPSLLAIQGLVLVVTLIATILLLVRKHIVVTSELLCIRESCMRNPKEIEIQDIIEARWGVKDSSIWTKGKKQFTIRMKSGENVNFLSLAWLTNKERVRFFDYLKSRGIRIID